MSLSCHLYVFKFHVLKLQAELVVSLLEISTEIEGKLRSKTNGQASRDGHQAGHGAWMAE